jgi:negative regulator of genetic competence, sporulation and motility
MALYSEITTMKQILENLALIDLINFCKAQKIDCSGTHIYKYPRRFVYALLNDKTGKSVVTVTFHKSSVPTHFIHQ